MNDNCIAVIKSYDLSESERKVHPDGFCYNWEEIVRKYIGIEGFAWPDSKMPIPALEDGLASIHDLDICIQYYKQVQREFINDHVNIVLLGEFSQLHKSEFNFVGYDYGCYSGEGPNFSAIYNDVIWRALKGLSVFRNKLNQHLLFDSIEDIRAFVDTRKRSDLPIELLEDDEGMEIFPVFIPKAIVA